MCTFDDNEFRSIFILKLSDHTRCFLDLSGSSFPKLLFLFFDHLSHCYPRVGNDQSVINSKDLNFSSFTYLSYEGHLRTASTILWPSQFHSLNQTAHTDAIFTGVVLSEDRSRVLLISSNGNPGKWILPAGTLELGLLLPRFFSRGTLFISSSCGRGVARTRRPSRDIRGGRRHW